MMDRAFPTGPEILMADDSHDDCRLVEMAFKRLAFPCRLRTASDGAALMNALRERELPDLILLDLNMPILNGFEALTQIKAGSLWRSIPIVIWSTSHSRTDVQEAYRIGTNAFMSKPDSFTGVVEAMDSLVQFWFTRSQLPQARTDNPNQ